MNARVLALAAACMASVAHAQSSPSFQPLGAPGGRFVFGQINAMRADQYLLDTQTGRLWQVICMVPGDSPSTCSREILQPVLIMQDMISKELLPYPPEPFKFTPSPSKK